MRRLSRLISPGFSVLTALAVTAGCWSQREPAVIESASYQAGYADGCNAASKDGGVVEKPSARERNRSEVDANYRDGWKDGFFACGGDAFRDFDGTPGPEQTPQGFGG